MATFQAKSNRGDVITIIQKTNTRRAGSFDDGNAKIQGLSTFVRADNHNVMNANQDFTEFTNVRREVREEAGAIVAAVRDHSSQPWPFSSSLMIGCRGPRAVAAPDGGTSHLVWSAVWSGRPVLRRAKP